jgi:hypothetical protein
MHGLSLTRCFCGRFGLVGWSAPDFVDGLVDEIVDRQDT